MIIKAIGWIANIVLLLLALSIIFLGYSLLEAKENPDKIPSVMGYSSTSVLTDSMNPALEPGDMIITKEITPEKVKVGDIITYKVNKNILITHRVVKIVQQDRQTLFQTKGDANNEEDARLVSKKQFIGTFSYRIPYGGYVFKFAQSTIGFIILIVLPIGFIMISEFKDILSQWIKESYLIKKTVE